MVRFKRLFFLVALVFVQTMMGQRNRIRSRAASTAFEQGWTVELDLGVDFLSNLMINPRVGAGSNRLGLGASFEVMTNLNSGRFSWRTDLNIQYAVQKVGNGVLEDFPEKKTPFQKNMDNIWLQSNAAYRTSYFSKFYYSADVFFSTQLTPTYEDNLLSDITGSGEPISKFLSPALFQFGLGIDYRANDYLSVFISPLTYRNLIVNDDEIANDVALDSEGDFLGTIHGNPFEISEDGSITLKRYDNQLGASMRWVYNNQVSDRLAINSNLILFTNYLRTPDHIDVNWRSKIDFTIIKNIKVSLLSVLSYDHDILVQLTDNDAPGGLNGLGRRVSYTQQLLVKYSLRFD